MSDAAALHPESNPVPPAALSGTVHVCLPSTDAIEDVIAHLAEAFPTRSVLVTIPDAPPTQPEAGNIRLQQYLPPAPSQATWVPAAADYVNAWTAAREHNPAAILVLGPDASSVSALTLRHLGESVLDGRDLALPRYPVSTHEALVNSAILYPLTRALFSNPARFPLPIDAALSPRMAQRMAATAQRLTAANQGDALVWPVAEAAVANYSVCDTAGDQRTLPHPAADDLNDLLAKVVGSIFTDAEAKASFWQRARLTGRSHPRDLAGAVTQASTPGTPGDIDSMIDSFRHAYTNLRELWSLVLPPNSLLSLKRLSLADAENFKMPDELWARTVYDFLLAFRLRTINRGHLLGALTPLYLAWVASHLRIVGSDTSSAERHIESVAAAFENDKPYLVSRWRWPDRFNP